jgi:uncharacterized repeat protein (TIGR02543 family)
MGSTMAQTDKPYVLKRQIAGTDHYLSHVKIGETWVLQDATTFDPETCMWYSGPTFNVSGSHHNYYFYDEVADKYHFLSAPLAPNADLGYSADLPTTSHLKNPDEIYYFYDWDQDEYGGGVARGHDDNGLWTVHWVAYSNYYHKWLTSCDSYHIMDSCAKYREVTITQHDKAFNWTQSNVGDLVDFSMDYDTDPAATEHPLSISIGNYSYTCTPAYTTYNFEGADYNYHDEEFIGINVTPNPSAPVTGSTASSYKWEISGEGKPYLSFSSAAGSNDTISNLAAPKVYYTTENTQGRKIATLTLTLTFSSGETLATLVRTATITVNTQCQNPAQAAAPIVNHNDVTVTWYPTATQYKVQWKKASESSWDNAGSAEVGNVISYTIYNLDQVQYQYRVIAKCGGEYQTPPTNPTGSFTPGAAPELMIYGSVFGGGRAANVTEKTEVVIVNCDSIGAVYGGNDIAGSAGGEDGSVITLGVDGTGDDPHTQTTIRIGSVYGGGNGYYAYDSTSFAPATAAADSILPGQKVYALSQENLWNDSVWINFGSTNVAKPTLQKTTITVTNDFVKVDSVFGGAKNAFVTKDQVSPGDATTANTKTTINGGTIFAVFGGNNVGGTLGTAKQEIDVTNTKTNLNTTKGLGRTHGIGYLFGGGNLVAGSFTDVEITGGQLDTIFGGGNRASVDSAYMMVNCAGEKRITAALSGNAIDPNYGWDGDTIYNVHTLFGGNNRAHMNGVPRINLTSGGVGTAYGGGNAGDMLAHVPQQLDDTLVNISSHLKLNSDNMIVDFLYGGCQMSNVAYCTWVEIMGGHVGTVYGGCNVSGDVGSTRTDPNAPAFIEEGTSQTPNANYQKVQGATYVMVTGGNVYRDVFAGSNGYYHCNDGIRYVSGMNYGDPDDGHPEAYDPNDLYVGLSVPTHNATNVKIQGGHIRGNVYAGGNLACVGFTDYTVPQEHTTGDNLFPTFVGLAFVEMSSGTVDKDVYGGGRMASVFGSNSVKVSGGTIGGALYGGNDRTGQVAQITNRVLPHSYDKASDGYTDLNQLNVKTYVRVTDSAHVNTVYGGGNGDYIYDMTNPNHIQFCGITPDEPIQSNTFVDIDINGGNSGDPIGHIGTVYGGGNGVTVINGITVFLNVKDPDYAHDVDHVDTIFGGNNKGSLTLVPEIILRQGKVNTVYGGCNKGAMYGDYTFNTGDSTYHQVGSLVRLREVYYTYDKSDPDNPVLTSTTYPTAQVTGAVYGGCRMNGVTNNSVVIVEGNNDDHVKAELFGGSDISGIVGGTSMVVVNGTTETEVGNVYGGGNGHYVYENNNVYVLNDDGTTGALIDEGTAQNPIEAPYCTTSRVDMMGGACATGRNLYAGGYAARSGATFMNIVGGTVKNRAFGGGNLAGTTTKSYTFGDDTYSGDGSSTVNVTGGLVKGGVYGGNNLADTIVGAINVNILGGTFGTSTTNPMPDGIFGGGYGNQTRTTGNVTVTVDKLANYAAPLIYGDVYGGSGYGDVNSPGVDNADSDDITTVNIFDGTINGDIYGGGLGQNQIGDDPTTAYPAHVNGKVYVNVGSGGLNAQNCPVSISGNATINGSVYGCNNINGTPLDSVFVNIYRTAHHSDPANNYDDHYPATPAGGWHLATLAANAPTQDYAISAVYGGGNKAAYLPPLANNQPRCTTVHVWDCQENTIEDVYGGGNAADVGTTGNNGIAANTRVIIDGGRMHRMFGGGNGFSSTHNHDNPSAPNYNPGANIYGTASSYVYAGLIDEVYGGANQWGSIDYINLNMLSTPCCTDAVYSKVFGCANEAPINHDIVTTVGCGVGEIGELYGGSNLASIGVDDQNHKANVTLNLYGGNYHQVFGGSKGSITNPTVEANIYGDVTLNLYGGTVIDAFGGNDQNGNIKGIVTVNVLDYENCPLDLTNVYGGSNKANYNPWPVNGEQPESPIVNVMHVYNVDGPVGQEVMKGIRGNVYGGGYQAEINAHPVVNIGLDSTVVVYGTTTMADLIPDDYPYPHQLNQLHDFPHAFISGKAFGGGDMAEVIGHTTVNMRQEQSQVDTIFGGGNKAGVSSVVVNVYDGKVVNGVYGGCNLEGTVGGDIVVNMLGGTLGTETDNIVVFGGGLGQPTAATDDVTVNIGGTGYAPIIYGTVYGGSALGSVNTSISDTVGVHLISGTVHGDVFGGGLGDRAILGDGHSDVAAVVNGNIHVVGDGTNVNGWVFGANDQNGDPAGTVVVTVNDGTITNVVGGGNVASYIAPAVNYPFVNVKGGTVSHKVVGGGNMANINGSPYVLIEGGTIATSTDIDSGIYGGCNTSGEVSGNTLVELTGGIVGIVVNEGQTDQYYTGHIHGGGFGVETNVKGNVTVNFGEVVMDNTGATPVEVHTIQPILYGELYGGSALGDVNTNTSNNDLKTTIVNLMNGTIVGEAYGGGLGQKAGENGATSNIEATVFGEVHVNVGFATDQIDRDTYTGMADLVECDVYGCNNLNGMPKKNVYVDVYKTNHTPSNIYENYTGTFAVDEVFGGGNRADYSPTTLGDKVYVYVHLCENTVRRVFGGGNAAYVPGVDLTIDGGRFDQVYGGGNGELGPDYAANVGTGGIHILLGGGRIRQLVNGSNDYGSVGGTITSETMQPPVCTESVVEDYFLGNNHTDLFEDIETTIYCDQQNGMVMRFVNLYCGSNQAKQYGNINVTIEGGVFENVYGGSKGDLASLATPEDPDHVDFSADIKIIPDDEQFLSQHPELAGRVGDGGNVTLTIKGGTIGDLYGGCNVNGNIEGKISMTIYEVGNDCGLFIGNIYGASNQTNYAPVLDDIVNGVVSSPEIKIAKADIGGKAYDLPVNNPENLPYKEYEGNVYGGGKFGSVTSNPKVIVGDGKDSPVTIEGDVFGGGHEGNVDGNLVVLVVPDIHELHFAQPANQEQGVIKVKTMIGDEVNSGVQIGEGHDVRLEAYPSVYGYKLDEWSVVEGDGHIANTALISTLFTMGMEETTIAVSFVEATTHTFTYSEQVNGGTIAVTDRLDVNVPNGSSISEGAELKIKATPASNNYMFVGWTVTSGNGIIKSVNKAETTFTMGTENTTITATFRAIRSIR